MNTIRELWNNRKMIWKLSRNDFKTKYAGSYFGILWAFVQPIVTTLIYVIIFQAGVKVQPTAAGYPYALVLISGIIPWFFFSEALQNSTNCFMEYSYLTSVFCCAGICDLSSFWKSAADTVYSDFLLYVLYHLFHVGPCIPHFLYCPVFSGFWTDREYRTAGVDVDLPHHVGYEFLSGKTSQTNDAVEIKSL